LQNFGKKSDENLVDVIKLPIFAPGKPNKLVLGYKEKVKNGKL